MNNMEEIDINEKIEIYQEAQKEANKEIFAMDLDRFGIETLRWISKRKIQDWKESLKSKETASKKAK